MSSKVVLMSSWAFAFVTLALLGSEISVGLKTDGRVLSRAKRYLVFPEGSTWSIAICSMTQAIVPNNNGIWTEAINWGISYDLPNETSTFEYFLFPFRATPSEARRSRRDLYVKMETILENVGFDGRICLLRAICDASRRYTNSRASGIFEEIMKRLFTFPLGRLTKAEPEEHRHYHRAYRIGSQTDDEENCSDLFPCPISLIDMALSGFSHLPQP